MDHKPVRVGSTHNKHAGTFSAAVQVLRCALFGNTYPWMKRLIALHLLKIKLCGSGISFFIPSQQEALVHVNHYKKIKKNKAVA